MDINEIKFSSGAAMMIRAILKIDPAILETRINEMIAKGFETCTMLQNAATHFDKRLLSLEEANADLASNNLKLIGILERWEHERRDFNVQQSASIDAASGEHNHPATG
ncbi:MAG: hypothetical protein ACRDNZ_04560 [Streptosporangiaceae bacterium]